MKIRSFFAYIRQIKTDNNRWYSDVNDERRVHIILCKKTITEFQQLYCILAFVYVFAVVYLNGLTGDIRWSAAGLHHVYQILPCIPDIPMYTRCSILTSLMVSCSAEVP